MRLITIYLFFILFFLSFFKGFGFQENSIRYTDTLSIHLADDKIFILNEKSLDTVRKYLESKVTKNPELANKYYEFYLARGIKENDDQIQFIAYYYLADISYEKGDYVLAIRHARSMYEIADKLQEDPKKIAAHNFTGNAYFLIRYYDNALEEYLKAYTLVKKSNDINQKFQLLANIGNTKIRAGLYKESLESFNEILSLLNTIENNSIVNYNATYLSSLLGAGVSHYKLKEYDKAIEYYHKGYALSKDLKENIYISVFNMTIGEAFIEKKQYDEALVYLNEANLLINNNEKVFNPNWHTLNYHLATAYYGKEKYEKALTYLQKNFNLIDSDEKERQIEKITEMYELAQQCAEKLSDVQQQLYYGNAYKRIIDTRHNDDIRTRERLYKYNIIELEEKNEDLLSKNTVYIIGFGMAVLLIILLLLYHFKKQKKNRLLFEKLQNKLEESLNKATLSPVSKKEYISDKKATEIFAKLKELEKSLFFLEEDCSLHSTAKKINTNTSYLSKIMNEYKEQSFSAYINELRIKHCCTELKTNQRFRAYTIKAIAGELGYKSVNTFASAFKKHTGLTHSYYIKQAQKI